MEMNLKAVAVAIRAIHSLLHVMAEIGMTVEDAMGSVHGLLADLDGLLTEQGIIALDLSDDVLTDTLFALRHATDESFPATADEAEARMGELLAMIPQAATTTEDDSPRYGMYL